MRVGWRLAAVVWVCCAVGALIWLAWPSGHSHPVVSATRTTGNLSGAAEAATSMGDVSMASLVVPGVQRFTGGQQVADQEGARRADPYAAAARRRSRTAYSHVRPAVAAELARTTFPNVVGQPAGGMPQLPAGARLIGYATTNAAQLALSGGRHAILESLEPIAKKTGHDHFTPIDLNITDAHGVYVPASPDVTVQIPHQLGAGVQTPEAGISLTPVDAQGHALGGSEGSVDGASVFYGDVQTATDLFVKPTVAGFQMDAMLRAAESPQELYFKVGLPQGAQLTQDPRTGAVSVEQGSATIATIPPPRATDAAQTTVPTTTHLDGDVLNVSVAHRSGSFQYPVELDPELRTLEDHRAGELHGGVKTPTNWKFVSTPEGAFNATGWSGESLTDSPIGGYEPGQSAAFVYETKGESNIYEIQAYVSGEAALSNTETYLMLSSLTYGHWLNVDENYPAKWEDVCGAPKIECEGPTVANHNNSAILETAAYAKGSAFHNNLLNANVLIAQEAFPTIGFNTSLAVLANGQANVFYGAGGWLGPNGKAFEVEGADPGIGISHFEINTSTRSWSYAINPLAEKLCSGVQCPPTLKEQSLNKEGQIFSYNTNLPDGEDALEAAIENPMAMWSPLLKGTIKVDSKSPYGIKITSGMAETGAEISGAPHAITVEATDGTKPTPSSGIKSLAIAIDGKQVGSPVGSCTPGECKTSATWTIHGESLGTGEHKLLITATDNAGNIATKEVTFAVRSATPVAVGPGSVDPTTGQYTLSATDVAISGAGGLSRTYLSRSPTAAVGPFGPEWNLSLGSSETLKLLPNGSAELAGASAGLTIFASNGSGGFVAPKGDGNLTLEPKEKEAGKGITEYLLKNPAAGTGTTFSQPAGSGFVTPSYFSQTGSVGSGAGQFGGNHSLAVDGKNNVWVADTENQRLEEFNEKGEFLATIGYGVTNGAAEFQTCTSNCRSGLVGSGAGQFNTPYGVTVDAKGNIWVADANNERIQEFNEKREFLATYGFGVSNGESKYEVCTSGCRAGIIGSGNGQFGFPVSLTTDAAGNIWVLENFGDRIQEFNEKKEFVTKFGTAGTGVGQFKFPFGLTRDQSGNIWVADTQNNRVEEFNSKNEFVAVLGYGVSNGESKYQVCTSTCREGLAGAGNAQFKNPLGLTADGNGDIWVADTENNRVEELNSQKEYLGKFGAAGTSDGQFTGTASPAIDAHGNMWVEDLSSRGRIEKWTHPLWYATSSEGPDGTSTNTQAYKSLMAEEKAITEPTEELGPVPTGVSCSPTLNAGCRALTFSYDTKTLATGENRSQWGEYLNRLGKVSFTGYNPSSKAMQTVVVAEYSYDSHGRLRSVWDPRISPALKTSYGYDSEGHVTAITPPGQESWAFTYGTFEGDSSTGRLLKATRAPASKLWGGELPTNTEAPKLSGSTVVGTTMGVSNGVWSNEPVAYTYQWQDCDNSGLECTPILGATNANYTLASGDAGHKLVVLVNAINGGGAVQASVTSAVVLFTGTVVEGTHYSSGPGSTVEYQVPVSGAGAPYPMTTTELAKWGQSNDIPMEATAFFPPDEPMGWPAGSYKRATVYYRDAHGRTTNVAAPSGGIDTVEYNATNEVTRKLSAANRATALKEGAKSAEVAKALSQENIYNPEETQLRETLGPEHKVKLASGSEVTMRDHEQFSYNEGAPSEEPHNLVTKQVSWGETAGKEVLAKAEVLKSYAGQGNLGWKLRKPTAITSEVGGHKTTVSTTYEPATGNPVEAAAGTASSAFAFGFQFGSGGSGNGQFSHPNGISIDGGGNVWVADALNNRIQKLSALGIFSAAYGAKGTAGLQFEGPAGIAVNRSTGNVYVVDSKNNRIQELSSAGAFVRTFGFGVSKEGEAKFQICTTSCHAGIAGSGNGQFKTPTGITLDSSGNVWVADTENARVEEFSESGEYLSQFGAKGTGNGQFTAPEGLAVSDGDIYVSDTGNSRIEKFSPLGVYLSAWGTKGSGHAELNAPTGIAADPVSGALYVSDKENNRIQNFSPAGMYLGEFGSSGSGEGHMTTPADVAVNSAGNIYVTDGGNARVDQWQPIPAAPVYTSQFGSAGKENGQFTHPMDNAVDSSGNLWVADGYDGRVEKFSGAGAFIAAYGKAGTGGTEGGQEPEFEEPVGVAVNQTTGNVYVTDQNNGRVVEIASVGTSTGKVVRTFGKPGTGGGEFKEPNGVAIDSKGNVWVTDYANNRVQEFTEAGVFMKTFGFGVSNGESKLQVCTSACRAGLSGSGSGEFSGPAGIAFSGENIYVTDLNNSRVEELKEEGKTFVAAFGSVGSSNGQFKAPSGIAVGPSGNVYVADSGNARIQEFTPTGGFLVTFGTSGSGNGHLSEPEGITVLGSGAIYVSDAGTNNRVEQWTTAPRPGNEGAKDSRVIPYTAAANAEFSSCGKHPEWGGLTCLTEPAAQPGIAELPELPVTTTTYNMWGSPETVIEKIGSVTRTKKHIFDGAGRETESEVSSTVNTGLPTVKNGYNSETGMLEKQSTTVESKTETITSAYNTLGQLATYTDADGNIAKYTYDIDGRVEKVSDIKGNQIYAYDSTTGFLTKLVDSAAGTFTATYDVSGKMLTENYPNGMTATSTYNPIGQATNLEYVKTTHCTEKCVMFSDAVAYSPKEELVSQLSSLSSESYTYNELGQLTQTQETPTGKGCTTRLYSYDEYANRAGLETREPNSKGECSSEGGSIEQHSYDVVGRLLDPNVSYDTFNDMIKVPAVDAGGSELASSFYVDGQVASQTQSGKSVAYGYDPAGRTRETVSGGKSVISHYDGSGEAFTWTSESVEKWTRNIPGIDGALDAIQTNGETPVLKIHNLKGDIVGEAAMSETETKMINPHDTTEFGVPIGSAPKYSWLGASGVTSEFTATGTATQNGKSYVPQLAREVQVAPVEPPGARPGGSYSGTPYITSLSPETIADVGSNGAAAPAVQAQRAREQAEAACRADPEACSEDPSWSGDVSIAAAESLSGTLLGTEIAYYVSGGTVAELAEKVVEILAEHVNVNFLTKLKEVLQKGIFGYSMDEVAHWAFQVGAYLQTCTEKAAQGVDDPKHPHCWLDIPTVIRHPYKGGPGIEIPNFGVEPIVGYCPYGKYSECLIQNMM
jgi:YD repeat-containing protein